MAHSACYFKVYVIINYLYIIFFLFEKSNANNGENSQQRDCPSKGVAQAQGLWGVWGQ